MKVIKKPPSQPLTGKVVLERLFGVLKRQTNNATSSKEAAIQVGNELIKVWSFGDGRIPLICPKTIQKKSKWTFINFLLSYAWIQEKAKTYTLLR